MAERSLDEILLPAAEGDALWEVFHENSKNGRAGLALSAPSNADTQSKMAALHESLPYEGYPTVELPRALAPLRLALDEAIVARRSQRSLAPVALSVAQLAALLHYAYGMLRDNTFVPVPARTRAVPSAGALYPLEIYLHSACVADLDPGLYHYSPSANGLHHLRPGDCSPAIAAATLYPEYVTGAALTIFLTAIFERSTWKYGDRGYRYALLEAGHVAQNISLVATALGLGSFCLGGYFDRDTDALLGIDGVTHSTLGMVCVGGAA